jgi:hypothetical protein
LPHASDFAPSGLLNTIIEFCKKTVYLPTIQTFFWEKSAKPMQFDNNGHLMPYEIQEISLDEFRYFFVEKLGDSGHRTQLFDNYLRFIVNF